MLTQIRAAALTLLLAAGFLGVTAAPARADDVYCPPLGGDCIVVVTKPGNGGGGGDSGGGGSSGLAARSVTLRGTVSLIPVGPLQVAGPRNPDRAAPGGQRSLPGCGAACGPGFGAYR